MIDKGTRIHTCDKCHKPISLWDIQQLVMRTHTPGDKHDICSSNIDIKIKKIADLCPECMDELIKQFIFKED